MSEHLDAMIPSVLEENNPCYIFYRLDDRNSHQNFLWVFMSYTPDFANVSDPMSGGRHKFIHCEGETP